MALANCCLLYKPNNDFATLTTDLRVARCIALTLPIEEWPVSIINRIWREFHEHSIAMQILNPRPPGPKPGALSKLRYRSLSILHCFFINSLALLLTQLFGKIRYLELLDVFHCFPMHSQMSVKLVCLKVFSYRVYCCLVGGISGAYPYL